MASVLSIYKGVFGNIQRNVWVLSIAMFINRSGSMVLLFTSLYLTKQLHFTISQAGIVMGFYGVGSILGSYAGGWLTDRRNHFDIMVLSLIASGLILLLMTVVTTLPLIILTICLYAFTADMFRPANSTAVASYSTVENRTRSVSLMRLAINLGFSVGPAIGGFIALYLGYKWLFVVDALTSFGAALMLYIYLPRQQTEKNRHENEVLNNSSTSAYRDLPYLLFIVLVASFGTCFFQIFASVPQYFSRVCGYRENTIGLLLALNGLLVVIIEMPLISAIHHKKNLFTFIIAGVLFIPISLGILVFGKGLMSCSIAYTVFITLSEIFCMPFMMNYVISRPPKERQGQYSALYSISYGIANIAAPSIGLGIADKYGFSIMFDFFIVLSVITAIGFYFLKQSSRAKPIQADD